MAYLMNIQMVNRSPNKICSMNGYGVQLLNVWPKCIVPFQPHATPMEHAHQHQPNQRSGPKSAPFSILFPPNMQIQSNKLGINRTTSTYRLCLLVFVCLFNTHAHKRNQLLWRFVYWWSILLCAFVCVCFVFIHFICRIPKLMTVAVWYSLYLFGPSNTISPLHKLLFYTILFSPFDFLYFFRGGMKGASNCCHRSMKFEKSSIECM